MKKNKVLCGLIFNSQDQLLITRRGSGDFKGKWEFPGGKLEENETEEECLKREVLEELNIEIDIDYFLMNNFHDYSTFSVELISYVSTIKSGEIKLSDHDKYEWVDIKKLKKFDFLERDLPIIEQIVSKEIKTSQ